MINKHWSTNTSKFYFIQMCQCKIMYQVPKISTWGPLPPQQTERTAYTGISDHARVCVMFWLYLVSVLDAKGLSVEWQAIMSA